MDRVKAKYYELFKATGDEKRAMENEIKGILEN